MAIEIAETGLKPMYAFSTKGRNTKFRPFVVNLVQ
jgi:hypothetical protein